MNNNSSDSSLAQQPDFGVKSLSKLLPIALVITLTNGLVLVLFCRRPWLRTSSNYPLLSLAVCDLFTGVVNIPYFIIFSFEQHFAFWMYALHTLMAVSAAYHILAIIAEKYLAIIRPLKHYLITKKMMFKILTGIWITSAIYAVIPIIWNESNSRYFWYIIHATAGLVFVFFVPYAFMIYAFKMMLRVIAKRKRPMPVHTDKSRLQQKSINDRKCVFVFAIMAVTFAMCWLPYFIFMLLIYVKHHLQSTDKAALEVFIIIRYMTSVFNPLIYTFFKRDFWLALRTLNVKRDPRFPLENRSDQRRQRWRSLRSSCSSTKSPITLSENAIEPSLSRHSEHVVYISSV